MRRTTLVGIVFASATLVMAQAPGGGMAPSQQAPTQRSGANNPMDQPNADSTAKVDDKKFLLDAAQGGMTEVELGKLAAQKASSSDVKQFAQKMVDDHSKANDELKQIATHENVSIPDAVDGKHQARIDKLSKLSGGDFDKAYVKDQLKDHQSDVRDFSAEAQNGMDPNIKTFASKTLPTLQEHLELVKNLSKAEKGK